MTPTIEEIKRFEAADRKRDKNWDEKMEDYHAFANASRSFIPAAIPVLEQAIKSMQWALPFLEDGAHGDERMKFDKELAKFKATVAAFERLEKGEAK